MSTSVTHLNLPCNSHLDSQVNELQGEIIEPSAPKPKTSSPESAVASDSTIQLSLQHW